MKRLLILSACLCTVLPSLQAGVLIYDDFNYPDGNIVVTSGNLWTNHSGSLGDSMVQGGKYEINQSRTDDVSRWYNPPNDQGLNPTVYASFTLNVSVLPSINGTYFAHFKDDTAMDYVGRLFLVQSNTVVPGTFRVGIANAAGTAAAIFPVDLATNVDHQVVVSYDTLSAYATLWVDSLNYSDPSVSANDPVSGANLTIVLTTYAFRQSANEGVMTVDNLLVATSFAEVATNAAVLPAVVLQPEGGSPFAGNDFQLAVVASGTGPFAFQWRKNGVNIGDTAVVTGSISNVLSFTGITGGESGSYDVVVTTPYGTATSAAVNVAVNTSSTAPVISGQPQSATNYIGTKTTTLTVTATGSTPLSYQWNFYGTNLPGATSASLAFSSGLTAGNTGPYYCTVSNPYGTRNSSAAYVLVLGPVVTNIAYLRTLMDANYIATNTTTPFQAEGIVTTHTNIGSAANGQCYIQDETAGIVVFVSGSTTFRPNPGDRLRVVGVLSSFNSLFEINAPANNPGYSATILSSGNPMPAAKSFYSFAITNDLAAVEMLEGSLITLTNVTFPTGGGTATVPGGATFRVQNAAGELLNCFVDARITNVVGKPLPASAFEVTGVLGQFKSNTGTPRSDGYQVILSRYEDIVATAPAPVSLTLNRSAGASTLTWPSALGSTYSVWASDNLSGPFSLAIFGANFLGETGQFVDTNTVPARFYRLSTP